MKKCLLFLLVLFAFSLNAQHAKQVYITLDVSGSMYGAKYEVANYTTQMLVSMCDAQDDIYIIINDKRHELSALSNPLAVLQHPLNSLPILGSGGSQFDDIVAFNSCYKPATDKQNWLFIIGDGIWGTTGYGSHCSTFKNIIKEGSLNVCYLQTGESKIENNDFTKFVSEIGTVDIRKSDTKPGTIQDECNYFAKKIMGFSDQDLNMSIDSKKQVVSFTAELPVSEFLIVYQDKAKPTDLPKIKQVSADGQSLNCLLKGTPSTSNMEGNVLLSGNVWRVKANSMISAGESIAISFDREVNKDNIHIYPIFNNIDPSFFILEPKAVYGQLKELDAKTSTICRKKDQATIIIELSEDAKQTLTEDLLKKTKVIVRANNREYTAKYENGQFRCDIKLDSDETQYNAEIDCPGYFKRTTSFKKIVKDDDCPIIEDEFVDLGTIILNDYVELVWTLLDGETHDVLDPNQFNYEMEIENSFLYEEPQLFVVGDSIHIKIYPKESWCECVLPTSFNLKLTATPKENATFKDGKQYEKIVQHVHGNIKKNNTWFDRCLWVLLTIGGLLLLIIYLRLLLKKNRFKKNATINPSVWAPHKGAFMPGGGYRLRKKGFSAWFGRWFLPFDEKRYISIPTPTAIYNFTFIATEVRNKIKFPIGQFDPTVMIVPGFDPDHAKPKATHIDLHDGGTIEISKSDGTPDAKIQFVAGKKNDEGGYRFFLGLLIVASLAAIAILIYLMIKAL